VFRHVTGSHHFKDTFLFYRLQLHCEPLVLNTWRSFPVHVEQQQDSGGRL